jgi:hypothetical protein
LEQCLADLNSSVGDESFDPEGLMVEIRVAVPFDAHNEVRVRSGLWHCNCRKPLGPYQLNSAHLMRCPSCGVARHSDPTVAANAKLVPHSPVFDGAGRSSPR